MIPLNKIRKMAEELIAIRKAAIEGNWAIGNWHGKCHENHSHDRRSCKWEYELISNTERSHHSISLRDPYNPVEIVHTTDEYGSMNKADAECIVASVNSIEKISLTCLTLLKVVEMQGKALEFYSSAENFKIIYDEHCDGKPNIYETYGPTSIGDMCTKAVCEKLAVQKLLDEMGE